MEETNELSQKKCKEHETKSKLSIRNISPNNNYNFTECFTERQKVIEIFGKTTRNLTTSLKIRKNIENLEKKNASKIKPLAILKLDQVQPLKQPKSKSLPNKSCKFKFFNTKTCIQKKFKTIKNLKELPQLNKGASFYTESNLKYRDYMEDYIMIIDNFPKMNNNGFKEKSLYIVCDGHSGADVAKFAVERFPEIFISVLETCQEEDTGSVQNQVRNSLTQSFKILDEQLVQYEEVGSTLNIIFMQYEDNQRVIYSGNIGDSRSILIKKKEAIRLSYDHKAIDKNEIDRVKKEGGIILKKRFYGTLAITRALGDYTFKIDGSGLSNIPYITRTIVEKDDQYVIMGSDGIWDVINEEKAYKLIQDNPQLKDPGVISKFFVEKSVELGSKDNISCIVIKLN